MNQSSPGVNLVIYRILIYGALLFWAFLCLFPIYWTITKSFKTAVSVTQGHLIPWFDFTPKWIGFRSLGLSPETIFQISTVREEFLKRFFNSVITSVSASVLAVMLGSLDDPSSGSPRIAFSGPLPRVGFAGLNHRLDHALCTHGFANSNLDYAGSI